MLTDFLDPLNLDEITEKHKPWATTQLGTKVEFYDKTQQDFEPYKLALIGVLEDRASVDNHGCGSSANAIRKELYQLYAHGEIPAMIDFGNILPGQTVKDTQFALKEVLKELFEQKITVIILGGGHDLTFGQYLAYENSFHHTDIVLIDEKIDIRKIEEINSNSFLWHLLNNEPSFLSSITHLGHQLFYTSPENIDILETLDFDTIRLGEIRNNIFEIEPYVRHADLLSFDISALKSADAPANAVTSPNGLTGEEACQLTRFAGLSNKTTSFGLYECNTYFDQNKQGVKQASQMVWYFIEGFANRREDDFPSEENESFTKYVVSLHDGQYDICFWKSNYSNKWWMEMPEARSRMPRYIPCSYKEYQLAMQDELPDRWMKAYNKLN